MVPDDPSAWAAFGRSFQVVQDIWDSFFKGDHRTVIEQTDQALAQNQAADQLHVSGLSLLTIGHPELGLLRLRTALSLYGLSVHWYSNSSIACLNAGLTDAAAEFGSEGAKRFPEDGNIHFVAANALMAQLKMSEAEMEFREALRINPESNDALINYGNCLRRLFRSDESLIAYESVLSREPNNLPAIINRVAVLLEKNRFAESEAILTAIFEQQPVPEVAFMLALIHLADGRYHSGFTLYRQRWGCAMAAGDAARFVKPHLPEIEDAAGKHVVIVHEQGYGDSLQFVRFAKDLLPYAAKVSILAPDGLQRLFALIDPDIGVYASREDLPAHDYEVAMLDLPYHFKTTVETIPATIPYFRVPDDILAQRALPPRSTKLRVGLVWAGQLRPDPDLATVDRRRSMHLGDFTNFMNIADVEFVSLQLGEPASQLAEFKLPRPVLTPLDASFDFLDTAAIICQLDLVITVDTAVAHLSAGLGVQTWVFSRFDACWRWLRNRTDSPWYPGCLRLFNQMVPKDWSIPLWDCRAALAALAAS